MEIARRGSFWLKFGGAVISGVLLWSSFPPLAQADSGWMALVTLLLVIRYSTPRAAAGWGLFSGLIFWVMTLSWFPAIIKNGGPWALVVLGQVALALWCAAYLGIFAMASARLWGWAGREPGWRRVGAVFADAVLWGGVEYARGSFMSGFAWNFLGVSQVENTALIQVAALAGVYGVSALMVVMNGGVAGLVERMAEPFIARVSGRGMVRYGFLRRVARSAESALPLAVVLGFWLWGSGRVEAWRRAESGFSHWRVALIQPNSPCIFEVDDDAISGQRELLVRLTRHAGEVSPDLTLWPETAVFGSVPHDPDTLATIREGAAAAGGGALMTGALEVERVERSREAPRGYRFYNAAWLYSGSGQALGRYRKQHLVPFGEYIPLDKYLPWLQRLAPTGVSCSAGVGDEVVHLARGDGRVLAMGPLICFEDTVPELSRRAVISGARMLVLVTNDAWFDGSVEPLQHANQAVFRAVESGVPMVRSANNGVSCVVDGVGRVSRYESGGRMTDFEGFYVATVAVPDGRVVTPYVRYGNWTLAWPGLAAVLALVVLPGLMDKARRRESDKS